VSGNQRFNLFCWQTLEGEMARKGESAQRIGHCKISSKVWRLASAFLLLAGIASATPILQLQDTNTVRVSAASRAHSGNSAVSSANAGLLAQRSSTLMTDHSGSGCAIGADCQASIKVPEPQSLMLVGSGLLSMAGLIRRRLLR
jgi:hypothetical protein